jgi:hypothetical protein
VTTELLSEEEVLSAEELEHFETQGYVKLARAVPPSQVSAAADAIWQFLGMDPAKPDDWYRPPHSPDGLVEIHQHQALWDNRQSPRVYAAFRQLWRTNKLWVSLDRASMKPPVSPKHPDWDYPPFLHWDVDLSERPIKFGLQGVLCLSDSTADHGGFHCIPGMHRDTIEWSRAPVEQRDINAPPQLDWWRAQTIEAEPGDLIIWHRALPHGTGVNRSDRPRLAQFILCAPAGFSISGEDSIDDPRTELYEKLRRQRIDQWERRAGPPGLGLDVRELGPPAHLTPLGRKLLGLDLWE